MTRAQKPSRSSRLRSKFEGLGEWLRIGGHGKFGPLLR